MQHKYVNTLPHGQRKPFHDEPGLGTFWVIAKDADLTKIHPHVIANMTNHMVLLTARRHFEAVPDVAKEGDLCGAHV